MNRKLGIDTSLEAYHVPVLHRGTIAKTLLGAIFLYEACGRHARLVAPRHGIEDQRSAETMPSGGHQMVGYQPCGFVAGSPSISINNAGRIWWALASASARRWRRRLGSL